MTIWKALERVSDPMFIIDPSGNILQANAIACERLGYPIEALIGNPIQNWMVCSAAAATWETGERRAAFRTHLGAQLAATIRVHAWSESGPGSLALMHAVLDSSDRMSVNFPLAAVSHEIRNPLSTILTWAQLGASERLGAEEQRRAFERIVGASWKIKRQLDDLFQLLNLSHDKLALNLEPFDVVEILKEAVFSISAAAEKKQLMLELEGFEEDAVAVVDRIRLFQVFSNLLGNAIKYTQPGGFIRVVIRRLAQELRISVSDNGEGIDPSLTGRVFEPFSQFGSHKGQHDGLGLGLAISAGIVKALGGRIWAESEGRGKGACFRLELRLEPAARGLRRDQGALDSNIARNALNSGANGLR